MQIAPLNFNYSAIPKNNYRKQNLPFKPVSFTSVFEKTERGDWAVSSLLTNKLRYGEVVSLIENLSKNSPETDIHCYGCADGSEPYMMALVLMTQLGDDSLKLFPIKASDISPKMINIAKSGQIDLNLQDKYWLYQLQKNSELKNVPFFTKVKKADRIDFGAKSNDYVVDKIKSSFVKRYKIHDVLREYVQFERLDAVSDLKNLDDNKCHIVFFRNIFPYLTADECQSAIDSFEKLKKGSLVILGAVDFACLPELQKAMQSSGFAPHKECSVKKIAPPYVFEKI